MSYFPELQCDLDLLSIEAREVADLVVTVAALPEVVPGPAPEGRLGTDVMSYPKFLRAGPRFEISFESVISYIVTDETHYATDHTREGEGGTFCRFTRSKFLDFVEATSHGVEVHPGFRFHYGIYCLNTCIDVVSSKAPVIVCLWGS